METRRLRVTTKVGDTEVSREPEIKIDEGFVEVDLEIVVNFESYRF